MKDELRKQNEEWKRLAHIRAYSDTPNRVKLYVDDLIAALKAADPVAEAIEMKLSPSDIEVLIHCHCRPCPHPRRDAPAVLNALSRFLSTGVIIRTPENDNRETEGLAYTTTTLGTAWINALCSVPAPRKVFMDEQDRVVGNT